MVVLRVYHKTELPEIVNKIQAKLLEDDLIKVEKSKFNTFYTCSLRVSGKHFVNLTSKF